MSPLERQIGATAVVMLLATPSLTVLAWLAGAPSWVGLAASIVGVFAASVVGWLLAVTP